jgi:ABC-2 type transport system permease protein
MLLLAVICLPTFVIVLIATLTPVDELPTSYAHYTFAVQVLMTLFIGAQAPVLVSRDLRHRVISLYLSRPIRRMQYLRAKLAAMTCALLVLIVLPQVILLAGALLAKLSVGPQLAEFGRALVADVGYAVVLASVSLLVASLTTRRGLGVAAIIAVLLVLAGLQSALQGIGEEFDSEVAANYAGLLSPYSLVDVPAGDLLRADTGLAGAPDVSRGLVYVGVWCVLVALCWGALVLRYRKVSVS